MKSFILVVGLMSSVIGNASVIDDINQIKSRTPEAGVVKYNEIKSLQFGDKVTTSLDYRIPTDHLYTVKQEVLCGSYFSSSEIQQGSNWGKII